MSGVRTKNGCRLLFAGKRTAHQAWSNGRRIGESGEQRICGPWVGAFAAHVGPHRSSERKQRCATSAGLAMASDRSFQRGSNGGIGMRRGQPEQSGEQSGRPSCDSSRHWESRRCNYQDSRAEALLEGFSGRFFPQRGQQLLESF